MPNLTDEVFTDEFNRMITEIKGGRAISITFDRAWSGSEIARFEYPRYGGNGRVLKPERALSAVVVGPHAETLAMLAEALGGDSIKVTYDGKIRE